MKKLFIGSLITFAVCCLAFGIAACGKVVSVSGISFIEKYVELYAGDEYSLEYTILPEGAENKAVSFYSSDKSVLIVDSYGTVYAVSQGSATVTVTTEDGGYCDNCSILVKERESQRIDTDDETKDNQDEDDSEDDSKEQEDGGNQGQDDEYDNDETSAFIVTFIADGKIVAECEITEDNLSVEEPELPIKNGYTAEWESYTLSLQDITVYAVYTPIVYNIYFKDYSGDIIYITNYTVESTYVDEPEVPARDYYNGKWEAYGLTGGDIYVYVVYAYRIRSEIYRG